MNCVKIVQPVKLLKTLDNHKHSLSSNQPEGLYKLTKEE